MKLIISGIHMELTDGIKDFARKKVEKLKKFFGEDQEVKIIAEISKNGQKAEIIIEHSHHTYIAKETTHDLYMSIEKALNDIESQARKHKDARDKRIRDAMRAEEKQKQKVVESEDEE